MLFNQSQFNEESFNELITGIDYTLILTESVGSTDQNSNIPEKVLSETIFAQDDLQGKIRIKGLADTIRLADWLTIKRNPSLEIWSD